MAFEISFVREHAASGNPRVWRIRVHGRDYFARQVQINTCCDAVYDPQAAPPGRIVCEGELVIVNGFAQIFPKKKEAASG